MSDLGDKLRSLLDTGKDVAQGASNAIAGNVSGPVDLISYGLRKAGLGNVIGDAPVGGSDWMAQKGITQQPKNALAGMAGETLGMAGPMVAAAKAPQVANGLLKMGENALAPATMNPQMGAIVYHGSPHTFDKFDMSKIGTGEGAQAYGHGLYFADSPAVAKQYQETLQTTDTLLNGKKVWPVDPDFEAATRIAAHGYDDALAMARRNSTEKFLTPEGQAAEAAMIGKIEALKNAKIKNAPSGGLYKVDLPDEHIAKMLDWDKPLSQQPDVAQRVLKDWGADKYQSIGDFMQAKRVDSATAGLLSSDLQKAGIPGIKYLDQGSRGAGQGTSNYVVFDDQLPKILERNGKSLADQLRDKLK